jgi:Secretion system C-terminal sorting domain
MKRTYHVITSLFFMFGILCAETSAKPSFNGETPGCGAQGCHSNQSGIVSVAPQGNLVVQVTLTGQTAGQKVAGELVDLGGTVRAVVDESNTNPFTLTAPSAGTYIVNAGYKQPQRVWDSVRVVITATSVDGSREGNPGNNFRLYQNYPNPFNPSTTFRFDLPQRTNVRLQVFDLQGRSVATLVDGMMESGPKEIQFDASGLASGMYLYRLQTGNFVDTKKMVLLR